MGEIIARNMLSRLELLINSYCCIYLVVYIICINDARSNRYHTYRRFGTTYRPHLPGVKNGFSEPLKMSNNPEGRSSHLLRSAILKSGPVGVQYDVQFISLTSWPNIDSFNSLKPRENKNKWLVFRRFADTQTTVPFFRSSHFSLLSLSHNCYKLDRLNTNILLF